MLGKSRRGVETDERHPDAQVFKYKYREGSATPRTESDVGEDGLSKLFKCQYRENSATPRAEPDMAGEFRKFLDKFRQFQSPSAAVARISVSFFSPGILLHRTVSNNLITSRVVMRGRTLDIRRHQ